MKSFSKKYRKKQISISSNKRDKKAARKFSI